MGKQAGPARPKEVRAEGRRLRHLLPAPGGGGRESPRQVFRADLLPRFSLPACRLPALFIYLYIFIDSFLQSKGEG